MVGLSVSIMTSRAISCELLFIRRSFFESSIEGLIRSLPINIQTDECGMWHRGQLDLPRSCLTGLRRCPLSTLLILILKAIQTLATSIGERFTITEVQIGGKVRRWRILAAIMIMELGYPRAIKDIRLQSGDNNRK